MPAPTSPDHISNAELLRGVLAKLDLLAAVPGEIGHLREKVGELKKSVDDGAQMRELDWDAFERKLEEHRKLIADDFAKAAAAHQAKVDQQVAAVTAVRERAAGTDGEARGRGEAWNKLVTWGIPAAITAVAGVLCLYLGKLLAATGKG